MKIHKSAEGKISTFVYKYMFWTYDQNLTNCTFLSEITIGHQAIKSLVSNWKFDCVWLKLDQPSSMVWIWLNFCWIAFHWQLWDWMSTLHGQETTLDEQPLQRVRANATEGQTSCIEYLEQTSQKFHSNCPLQYKTTHAEKQTRFSQFLLVPCD